MTDYLKLAAESPEPAAPAGANPYLDLVKQDQVAEQARARSMIEMALKDNPDVAAERQRLAKTSGLPLRVVERNLDEVRLKEQARAIDLLKMAQDSPVLARQLTDPTFTTLAIDDVDTLTEIERAVGHATRYMMGAAPGGGVVGDLKASLYRSASAVAGAKMSAVDLIEPWARLVAGDDNWFAGMSRYYADQIKANNAVAESLSPRTGSTFSDGVSAGVQSFGQNVKYMPLALAGPGGAALALGGMVMESFGTSYGKAADKNLPLWQKLGYASSDAMIEYWTEKIPMDALIGGIRQGAPFIQVLAKQLALEIPGEQLATVLQDLNEWATLNPGKPFADYLKERPDAAAQTLIATVIGTGGNVAVTSGVAKIADSIAGPAWRDNLTTTYADMLAQQLKLAGQSALRERSPEQFRAHVQRVVDSAEAASKSVWVDGQVLNQLPEEVLNQLPEGVRAQIADAAASGDTVEIPMADVLTVAPGTPLEQVLNEHARLDPFAASKAEVAAAQDVLKQEAARVIQEASDQAAMRLSADAVQASILGELNTAARYRPAVNEQLATWATAFYTTMAARTGMTPEQFYQRYRLRILGEPSAPGAAYNDASVPGRLDGIEAYHWSAAPRPVLSSAFYGTGLKGSARDEIMSYPDERIRQRLSFYVDKGTGVRPEAGVGGVAHRVRLDNIYDANVDPLKLRGGNAREFESRVLDAGFDGYLDRLDGDQPGQVIMLGARTVQPEVLGPLSRVEAGQRVPALEREPAPWRTQASGSPEMLQARLERMQANPTWAKFDMRIEGNELQVRERDGVFEQSGREGGDTTYADKARALLDARPAPVLSTVAVMDGKEEAPRFKTITDLAAYFTKKNRSKARDLSDPKVQAKIADALYAEALHGLTDAGNAIGWYDRKTKAALDIITEAHPDLATDEQARFAFIAILAVTSNGLRSRDNFVIAERLYRENWKTDKRFPETVPDGGQRSNQMGEALALLNRKIDELGWQAVRDFMGSKHTAKEVRDFAGANSFFGEQAAAEVPGALFLGPKLGSFFNNLYGDFSTVTMDRWFMRTVNRIRGNMLSLPASFTKNLGVLRQQIEAGADTFGVKSEKILAEIAAFEMARPEQQADVLFARSKLKAVQQYARARHRDYARSKDDGTGKKRSFLDRTPENYLAKNIDLAMSGSNDAPSSASDRTWIRGVINQVQARFAKDGIEISNADLQAVLWYYEKDLYAKLISRGGQDVQLEEDAEPKEAEDYETAARYAVGRLRGTGVLAGPAGPARPGDAGRGTGDAGTPDQGGLTDERETGDRGGRYSSGSLAPLAGAPAVAGASGPGPRLVAVAEQYARANGIPLRRQAAYAEVDPGRADPAVREAYADLIRQTKAQYDALVAAGYQFWFMDPANDPYQGNPWNAMRDLRANQSMAVFPTEAGFGSGGQVNIGLADPNGGPNIPPEAVLEALRVVGAEVEASAIFDSDTEPTLVVKLKKALTKEQGDFLSGLADQGAIAQRTDDEKGALFGPKAEKWGPFNPEYFVTPSGARGNEVANPLLQDTGVTWPYGSPDGEQRPVLANDLFRAVHDAFGHGLEGAGFRAQGEENAWQAHVRLFTGPAVGAITTETRGQNSWLNYGPHGEANQTAKVEDTVFADQKTGLMPEWTWTEGRVGDEQGGQLEQQAQQSARGTFNPRTLELVLNPNANLSTFFHETGHFFLEVLADIASQPGAPAQIVEDFGTFLKWAGVSSEQWAAFDLDQKRPYHERWAESIEQYVMEGRAPSVELQPLMRRFAAWLKSVYGSIKKFLAARGVPVAGGGETLRQPVDPFPRVKDFHGMKLRRGKDNEKVQADSAYGDAASFFLPGVREIALADLTPRNQSLYETPSETKRIEDLAAAIKKNGSIEPVLVARAPSGALYVAEGQHRWRALKLLGYASVPARVALPFDDVYKNPKLLKQDPTAPTGPPMQLNDDIRRVMDRLLATDEQIAQAEEVAGMTPSEEATAEAAEKLRKRGMRDLAWSVKTRDQVIAELQKRARQVAKAVREAVTAEVDQMPEVRAKAALDALNVDVEYDAALGEWKKARDAAEAAAKAEITEHLVAAEEAKGEPLKGLKKGQFLAKVKAEISNKTEARMIEWERANKRPTKARYATEQDLATIADSFGFEGVDAMLQAIDAFDRRDLIDGMTDQRMLEEHGDLIDERAIAEAANEAVHNLARQRMLASELRTQAELLNERTDTGETNARGQRITVNALVEAAKQFGASVVGRTPLRDLKAKAWQHTAAERRAAKRYTEMTAKGKTLEAVEAKRDQVLQNAAAKAALEAQAEAKKILEFFARVAKGNDETVVEKGRDPDIVNAARAVLAAYGLQTPTTKRAADYLEVLRTNDAEMFAVIAPMVDSATQNAQPLQALTFDELVGLHEAVEAMWHLAKRTRQMEVAGNLMDREELADELFARMEEIGIPDRIPGEDRAVTQAEERGLFLQQGLAFLRRVEQWAENMDGRYGGPFLRYVFQPIKDAADRYRADRLAYRKKLQALVDNIAPIVGDQTIDAPELGYTFGTPGSSKGTAMNEILHAIAHTGNDSNKRKLLLGRGWATELPDGTLDTSRWDAFINRLVNEGKLEQAHFDFVQGVWDLLEETKPLAQRAHRDAFGRYFAEVTANSFVDPFGVTRRGGYVPAVVDAEIVRDNELRKLAEAENENMAFAFPQPNKGFTFSRTEYNRPLMLDLRTLGQHLDKVLLFSHMTVPARDVRKLITDKKVGQPLTRIQPAAVSSMLQPWLQRSAQQIVETPVVGAGKWARVPGIIRARAGMALMFANVSNALQQLTGFANANVKVRAGFLRRALAQYVAHPVKFSRAVWDSSNYMADRASNEVAMMNEQMQDILIRPGIIQRAQSWSMRHAYFLQTAIDNVMSPIIWSGAYNQALADGMVHDDAVRFADGVVRQTQGSTLPEDVSRFETGPAYARVFTQFIGYFNMMANTNATAIKQIAGEVGLKKGAGRALHVVLMGLMVPLWVAEAIAQGLRGGPEDEDDDGYLDDWLAAVFGFGTIKGLLAMIPIAGQAANSAVTRLDNNPLNDRISLSPGLSLIESALGGNVQTVAEILDEDKDVNARRAVRDAATLVSIFTGVPVYAAARPAGYLAGVMQGDVEPTGPVDLARGLITGAVSPESRN